MLIFTEEDQFHSSTFTLNKSDTTQDFSSYRISGSESRNHDNEMRGVFVFENTVTYMVNVEL